NPIFDSEEETTIAIAWISFIRHRGNILFGINCSCARVKVEVDLLGEFSKCIYIGRSRKLEKT
ncbi:hypothetical protein H5410_046421, partial [Solanum commersonii]